MTDLKTCLECNKDSLKFFEDYKNEAGNFGNLWICQNKDCNIVFTEKTLRNRGLGTLKDLKYFVIDSRYNKALEDLRQEVIKWIKELEKDFSEESEKPLLKPMNKREYWLFTENRQRWMNKFNITEEDLKKESIKPNLEHDTVVYNTNPNDEPPEVDE